MADGYELVGGQPVKVTPLEATEAGTYKAPHGQAFNPVTVTGGGGGGLPPITPTDDGSFPVAQDGAWSKVGGYSVSESSAIVIPEQTITGTSITGGSYSTIIAEPDISAVSDGTIVTVTFDGTAYDAPAQDMNGEGFMLGEVSGGSPVYTNYPFVIVLAPTQAQVIKYGAEPVVISAAVITKTVTVTDDFKMAVEKALDEINA